MVILHSNKEYLHFLRKEIQEYLDYNLKLELSNYQVFKIEPRGIDFLGYVTYHNHCKLRKSIKKKFINMIKTNKNDKSIASYNGWFKYCHSKNLQNKYLNYGN